ncbi:protein kinase domain containing protein [Stylonychia lemnae]|uniref:non-specific serine/threonine protein kinase n=1 Tax=Stylonychia lemnae TaxID=5949 RepID=A0A078BAC1_STYLE|nr:protein kinase domain containing protein [Stylonychia lemnae]|eukprot:CDW91500.1 protein kinase domain containing protein [Stylonychia lemnae]
MNPLIMAMSTNQTSSILSESVAESKILVQDNNECSLADDEDEEPSQNVKRYSKLDDFFFIKKLVMEYADNGDLYEKILELQRKELMFTEDQIWKLFIQIVNGLKSLHDLKIMHRDLKSANLFLNKDYTIKLGDMNVSKVANQKGLNYTQTGTPYYASPEVWRDESYDIKSDIWSLGCVLYEMITLQPPFKAENMDDLFKLVMRGNIKPIPKQYSNDLQQLVKLLLSLDQRKRPTCEQIMNSSAFRRKHQQFQLQQQAGGHRFEAFNLDINNTLLKTINFPKDLLNVTSNFPQPNYNIFKSKKAQAISKTPIDQENGILGSARKSEQYDQIQFPQAKNKNSYLPKITLDKSKSRKLINQSLQNPLKQQFANNYGSLSSQKSNNKLTQKSSILLQNPQKILKSKKSNENNNFHLLRLDYGNKLVEQQSLSPTRIRYEARETHEQPNFNKNLSAFKNTEKIGGIKRMKTEETDGENDSLNQLENLTSQKDISFDESPRQNENYYSKKSIKAINEQSLPQIIQSLNQKSLRNLNEMDNIMSIRHLKQYAQIVSMSHDQQALQKNIAKQIKNLNQGNMLRNHFINLNKIPEHNFVVKNSNSNPSEQNQQEILQSNLNQNELSDFSPSGSPSRIRDLIKLNSIQKFKMNNHHLLNKERRLKQQVQSVSNIQSKRNSLSPSNRLKQAHQNSNELLDVSGIQIQSSINQINDDDEPTLPIMLNNDSSKDLNTHLNVNINERLLQLTNRGNKKELIQLSQLNSMKRNLKNIQNSSQNDLSKSEKKQLILPQLDRSILNRNDLPMSLQNEVYKKRNISMKKQQAISSRKLETID